MSQTIASLRPSSRCIIFIGAVFTEAALTNNEILIHKVTLQALAPSHIQQRHLIAAFEWFSGVKFPQFVRYFPMFLKQLFDEDIVEEDVFVKWGQDISRNEHSADYSMITLDTLDQLKSNAEPFLKWLMEAEEEGDDDEDSEDDDDSEDA